MIQAYGLSFPDGTTPATVELFCFAHGWAREQSGLTRYQHCRNAIDLLWNIPRRVYAEQRKMAYDFRKDDALIWNEWSELMIQTFCEGHWCTAVWGPNASWKTTCMAVFFLVAWYASPANTIVVLTTTSLPGLRKRVWKEVLKYHRLANPGFGYVHASDFAIRFEKGSDEAGIFGVATGQDEGDIQKAVDKIIGFHNTYAYAGLDEGQATNFAIVTACLSIEAGSENFQLIIPGNPDTELDTLGQMSEPVDGYHTITAEMDLWTTKRGVCVHLDGLESPRVKEGDQYYPGLLRQRDIDSAVNQYGEDSPEFWRTRRGFIAPQGVTKTVLSPSIIEKFKAKEKAIWVGSYVMGAGLDPAFEGGDRCMLRFGKCGAMTDGKTGIELGKLVQIKVSATSKIPIEYQILEQVRLLCEQHDPPVAPENFATDCTGTGRGLASIFQREWSPAITLTDFNGRASDLPVSEHDPKPCSQEYLYKVTELWYQARTMVQNGIIRGLDTETAIEFCQRIYSMRGNLKMVESKADMKKRTRKSPDLADATVVLLDMFRRTQNLSGSGETGNGQTDNRWEKFRREQAALLDADSGYLIEV